ncbi:MAG: O-antigen ligase family protein [Parcubacteria group bacterium]|nr:O-antigen ligase family protein [Parcubacteria group bacterium]
MSLIIITILLALYAVLSAKKTVWGVFGIAALLPTYLIRWQLVGTSSTLLEGMIIVLLLVFLVKQVAQKKLGRTIKESLRCRFAFPAFLLLVAATIAVFVAPDRLAALGLWKAYFVEPILLLFVFVNVVETKKQLRQVVIALAASATFIALTAIVQYFTGWGIPESYDLAGARRATSFYGYPAAVGLFIAPILSLVLAFVISNGKKAVANYKIWLPMPTGRQAAGLAVCVMTLALVFAKTEGAWLGVLAATFFALLFTKYRLKIIVLGLVAVIILLAIPVTRDYIVTLATFQDVSGEVRIVLWQGTTRLLADNPIFGAGLAGFPELYEKYKEARHVELSLYPHNIFLNFWVETGVLGLVALLLIIWQYFKRGIKNLGVNHYALPLLAAMVCILVYGLVDAPYFKNDLSVLFWILVGMVVVTGNITKNEKPS